MKSRSCFAFGLTSLAALFLSHPAVANSRDDRGHAAGARAHSTLERDYQSAMADMDRSLAALLASRTMDCLGEDADRGMETCWVSLDSAKAADVPVHPHNH